MNGYYHLLRGQGIHASILMVLLAPALLAVVGILAVGLEILVKEWLAAKKKKRLLAEIVELVHKPTEDFWLSVPSAHLPQASHAQAESV
jgi:hypothetical protein